MRLSDQQPPWPIPRHPTCRWCQHPIRLAYIADRFDWHHIGAGYPCPDRHIRPVPHLAEPSSTHPQSPQTSTGRHASGTRPSDHTPDQNDLNENTPWPAWPTTV